MPTYPTIIRYPNKAKKIICQGSLEDAIFPTGVANPLAASVKASQAPNEVKATFAPKIINGSEEDDIITEVPYPARIRANYLYDYTNNIRSLDDILDNIKDQLDINHKFTKWRKYQKRLIKDVIHKFVDENKRVVACVAPTGAGKSLIAAVLGVFFQDSYIIPPLKVLQDQYANDFARHMAILKGRGSYICAVNNQYTCDNADCVTSKIPEQCKVDKEDAQVGPCLYKKALHIAESHPLRLLNMWNYYFHYNFTHRLSKGNLLIFDEAHNLESVLASIISCNVNFKTLASYGIRFSNINIPVNKKAKDDFLFKYENLNYMREWVKKNSIISQIEDRLDIMMGEDVGRQKQGKDIKEDIIRLAMLKDNLLKLDTWTEYSHVVEFKINEDQVTSISAKPIVPGKLLPNFFFTGAKHILLMSATLPVPEHVGIMSHYDEAALVQSGDALPIELNKDAIIWQKDYCELSIPSTFPYHNRPCIPLRVAFLNRHNIQDNIPKLCTQIANIMDYYQNEKGIIHVSSYILAVDLVEYLSKHYPHLKQRLITHHDSNSKSQMLKSHYKQDAPTVIVSPSLMEGISLDDNFARFQIIVKIPYPSLGDKQVRVRLELDPTWYNWLTVIKLIQAYGRGTRSKTDWCATYILDSCIDTLILDRHKRAGRAYNFCPKWFLDGWVNNPVKLNDKRFYTTRS